MSTLGTRIAEYRHNANLTQDQLAEKTGVTSQAVSKWENDLSCPDITLLPQLSDIFGITIDELLRGEKSYETKYLSESQRKDFNKMILKIKVNSQNGDKVNVNLPLALIKAVLEIGISMPEIGGNNNDIMKNIDFGAILSMAESGLFGKIVEVETAAGDNVEVYIE